MKKFFAFLFIVFSLLMVAFPTKSVALAAETNAISQVDQIKNNINYILSEFVEEGQTRKERASRIPGSRAELNAANYIKSKLKNLNNFKPVNNASTVDGVEKFEFVDLQDGITKSSQNIVFLKESMATNKRKVIIGAHYDTSFVADTSREDLGAGVGVVTDGVNDNAAGVATLLSIASSLDKIDDLGFSIEVVFFGAGSNDYVGSKFHSRGMSDEDADNTLLFINLDRIALGDYTYMYVNEFESSQQRYFFDTVADLGFKKFKHENIVDFYQKSPNGLDYSHVGLESDHAIFMSRDINVLSFFSGNYEKFLTAGLNEYDKHSNITFTELDAITTIRETRPNFIDNLAKVEIAVETILSDNSFIAEMVKNNGAEAFRNFYMNDKIPVFITSILLVVCIFACYLFYLMLQKKSRQSATNKDVERVVTTITTNLGEDDDFINKAIGQKVKRDTVEKMADNDDEEDGKNKEDKNNKKES